jgi:hypothetical protein
MRFVRSVALASLISLALCVSSFAAAPTLDGAGCSVNVANGTSSNSCAITTASGSDLVVVAAFSRMPSAAGAANLISTVTASGLTFTRRATINQHLTSTVVGSDCVGCWGALEIWAAPASGPLSAVSITVTYTSAFGDGSNIVILAAAGLLSTSSPWDLNASLPATNFNISNSPTTEGVTLSTTAATDLLLWVCGTVNGCTCPAGFLSHIQSGGVFNQVLNFCTQAVTSVQTSQTFNNATSNSNWQIIGDALVGGAAAVSAGKIMLGWP